MADDQQIRLPQGYEDAVPFDQQSQQEAQRSQEQHQKEVEMGQTPLSLPQGYEDAVPAEGANAYTSQSHPNISGEAGVAADTYVQPAMHEMRAAEKPSTMQRFWQAAKHPIDYLGDVESDVQEGGGRTIVGRTLGAMQGRGDKGYDVGQRFDPSIESFMAAPIQGPPKLARGAMRMYKADTPKEAASAFTETATGALQTLPLVAPEAIAAETLIPRAIAGEAAGRATSGALNKLGVAPEYSEAAGTATGLAAAGGPELKERFTGTGHDPAFAHLQKDLDIKLAAANEAAQKMKAYEAGAEQGVPIPDKVVKDFQKARYEAELAQRHHDAYLQRAHEQQRAARQQFRENVASKTQSALHKVTGTEPAPINQPINLEPEIINPDGSVATPPAQEPQAPLALPAAPEATGPANVKTPGQVPPEVTRPELVQNRQQGFENLPQPNTMRSGPVPLANEQGVMGRRMGLPAKPEEPIAPVQAEPPSPTDVRALRTKMVPAKEMAGFYAQPKEAGAEVPAIPRREASTGSQVDRIADLTRQGLGGQELKPNVPLKEQTEQKLSSRPDKAALQKAGASEEAMNKILAIKNPELSYLAMQLGEDMGTNVVGRSKGGVAAGTHVPREQILEKLLQKHSPDDLAHMIDEGKHLPPVGGGSQAATEESDQYAGTALSKEAVGKENDWYKMAKEELGPDAGVSQVLQRAQEIKEQAAKLPPVSGGSQAADVEEKIDPATERRAAKKQLAEHNEEGGSTFDRFGKSLKGTDGYAVGVYPERTQKIEGRNLSEKDIRDFKSKNSDVLSQPDHAVGTWTDEDGTHWLDITKVIPEREDAIKAGKEANQNSIYNLQSGELIKTGGTGSAFHPLAQEHLPTVSGSSPETEELVGPITKKLIERYGTTKEPLGSAQFITADGKRVPVQDHDRAVASVLNKKKIDPNDRVDYINNEQAVRVRFRSGPQGKEVVFSVPKNVSPEQINQMENTVAALGKFGNMHMEQADAKGNYVTKVNATPEMVEKSIKEVNKPSQPWSPMVRAFHQ